MTGAGPPDRSIATVLRQTLDLPALFDEHYLHLVRLAAQLVDDVASAEDVVQDVFTRLQMRRQTVLTEEPLAYLRTAVLNTARSALRRRRTARAFLGRGHRPPEQVESADRPVLLQWDQDRILRAISRLPSRQREVIVLRYYEDLSIAETAAMLGISQGAVSSSASVALSTLSARLGDRDA